MVVSRIDLKMSSLYSKGINKINISGLIIPALFFLFNHDVNLEFEISGLIQLNNINNITEVTMLTAL